MATLEPESSVSLLPELPVLPYYKDFPVVIGRKFTFSDFGDKTFAEMLQILPDLMGPADNIVIHLGDAIEPVPFTQLSLNDLENLVVNKLRSESSAIISEGNLVAFNNLLAEARAGGHNNEENTGLVYDFVYVSIMEAVAAKIIKHFYLIIHPFNGNSLTLLGNRGIYTEDKQKRDAAERRLRKKADQQAKAQAKAAKEADNPKMTSQELEEFVNSDASGHGGNRDSSYSSEADSGSDTTIELEQKSQRAIATFAPPPLSTMASGNQALASMVGTSSSSIPQGVLGPVIPLGAPMGGAANDSPLKRKKSAKTKHHRKSSAKKSRSKKSAKASTSERKKPKKTVVVKPTQPSSSSSNKSESSSDEAITPNVQQVLNF